MATSGVQNATAAAYADIRRLQAQQALEAASARADALAAQASAARKEAHDAQRRADQLDIEAGTAKTQAGRVALAASQAQGVEQAGKKLDLQLERIAQAVHAASGNGGVFGKDGKLGAAVPAKVGQLIDVRS